MSPPSFVPERAVGGLRLAHLADREVARVTGVAAPAAAPHWQRHLEDLGFESGERVEVITRARPGLDPLVVRIGGSTFALRRAEAECVRVALEA